MMHGTTNIKLLVVVICTYLLLQMKM